MKKIFTLLLVSAIYIQNINAQANAGPDREICADSTYMQAVDPNPNYGQWTVLSGSGTFTNPTLYNSLVSDILPGINVYRWEITVGMDVFYDDVLITNNSVASFTGDPSNVCTSSGILSGNIPASGETGTWSMPAGPANIDDIHLYNSTVNSLNTGINTFVWTIEKGSCSDDSYFIIINNGVNAVASVVGSDLVCIDEAFLTANVPISGTSGLWSVWAGGGTFDNPGNPATRVSGLLKGINIMKWTVSKGACSSSDEVNLTNNSVEASAGDDIITCETNANLQANEFLPGENGLWTVMSGSGSFISPEDNETLVTGLNGGINVFRWSVSGNGCSAYDEVSISNNSFITTAGFDQHVCSTNVTLQGQNPMTGTGIWSYSGPNVTIVNPTLNTTIVIGLQDNSAYTFRWTVTKNGCTAWDDVVIYNDLVHAHAGADFATCTSNTTLAAENPIAGSGAWTITAGAGMLTTPTYYASGITNLGLGSNTLVWTVTNLTCMDADIVIVTNNKVTATAGADILTCINSASLNGDQPIPGGYGVWEVVGGPGIIINPSSFNTMVINLQRGINTLRWTVYQNGCNNGGDLVMVANNSFDAYAGEDQNLPPMTDETYFDAELTAGQTGYWSIMAGSGNISNIYDPASYVDNLPNGLNTFRWNVTNPYGCSDSDHMNIYVANFITYAGPDQIVCADTAKLNATHVTGADDQKWSIISGVGTIDDIYDPKTVVRNILWGANIYRWTVYFPGYSDYDEVVITNDSIFVSAGDDASVCGDTYQMNAQYIQGASHFWSPIGLGGGTIENSTSWNTLVTNLPIGQNVFNWFVDNGNCQSNDIVIIERKAEPIADFTVTPEEFIAPQEVLIENISSYVPGFTEPDEFTWFINDEFLVTTYNYEALYHTFTNTGTLDSIFNIELRAVDNETGCIDTVTHSVLAHPSPESVETITSNFKLYPNPANDRITIESNFDLSDAVIEIENASGQSVYRSVLNQNKKEYEIDISSLADGFYVLKIISDHRIKLMKFVKK